ncbi:FecR domain-containing protein [Mucilaginibacter sp. P25]|uniref:Ferric-dicitrate binding protein FerR, regulates iron transport through sigma-19 n=1 Tax=Mucilaginibacter gossypii TaxID=551996 RepID=A0A1G8HU57_9SPHI|nr:FecR domain-containing protein [Mucilaginibacter gossypii]SDI10010.1 ferric-dicitrate binding protein FerR, regulates iron transport through sigma-19 [Mucilaginibacter gossypii]
MSYTGMPIDDDLLVKYLVGEATPAEVEAIQNWIAASPANRQEYDNFKLIWDESQYIASTKNLDEDASYFRLQKRLNNTGPATAKPAPVRKMKASWWVGIAASLLLVCTVTWLTISHYYDNRNIAFIKVESEAKTREQTLPDGSIVTMNSHSTLIYPEKFTGKIRPVTMLGEAFFKVTPDKTKPFIIRVNGVTVRVVGTSFNVKSRDGKTQVIVETGIVNVSEKNKNVNLNPGEKVLVTGKDGLQAKESIKGRLYNYYATHELLCDETPLNELVGSLNEVYGAHIVIGNKAIANLPITTVFKDQSLDQVLVVISETFKIKVERGKKGIVLK